MTDVGGEIERLVAIFLPMDRSADGSIFGEADPAAVASASLASFSVAVTFALQRMDEEQRRTFCRRVAEGAEGDVQAWMVEAALRSIGGDTDAMTGVSPAVTVEVHFPGLTLLTGEYLTAQECHELRGAAVQYAEELYPQVASLPH